jgi:hypothetical protein
MAQFQGEGASRSSTFDLDQSEGEQFRKPALKPARIHKNRLGFIVIDQFDIANLFRDSLGVVPQTGNNHLLK